MSNQGIRKKTMGVRSLFLKQTIRKSILTTAVLVGSFVPGKAIHAMELSIAGIAVSFHQVYTNNHVESPFIKINDSHKVDKGAEKFINSMANRALDFLDDDSMTHDQKRSEFRKLLQDSFDMSTIGRFSLGRYWRVSTAEQRREYQSLFKEMVIDVYSDRFGEYTGETFETRGFRADGEKDTIVNSFIVPDAGPEVQVDWRVRYKNGRYQVVDVIVEGVSMSVTQRSDFASVIQRGGGDVEVLLSHLKSGG